MRTSFLFWVFVLAISSAVHAQTVSLDGGLSDILDRMQSTDTGTRETAFHDLSQLMVEGIPAAQVYDSGPGIEAYRHVQNVFFARNPDQADRVKLGLIRLLTTETKVVKSTSFRSGSEDYTEYFFSVTQAVSALNDDRAIPALVGTISSSGVDLLQYGDKALGPVLGQLKSRDALERATALEIASRILESKKDRASHDQLGDTIRSSLADSEPVVRRAAIQEIICLDNRKDFVPILERIARTDISKLPGRADDGGDNGQFYPVRFEARRTLRAIQSNQPCPH